MREHNDFLHIHGKVMTFRITIFFSILPIQFSTYFRLFQVFFVFITNTTICGLTTSCFIFSRSTFIFTDMLLVSLANLTFLFTKFGETNVFRFLEISSKTIAEIIATASSINSLLSLYWYLK